MNENINEKVISGHKNGIAVLCLTIALYVLATVGVVYFAILGESKDFTGLTITLMVICLLYLCLGWICFLGLKVLKPGEALDEQDAYWEGLRKTYQDLLKQDISDEEKADIRKLLAEIDKNKAESKRQVLQQVNNLAQEGRSGNAGVNPADFSDERLLTIKRNLRKYVLGRKIWGFDRVRDFRNGFVAVGYTSDDDFGDRWGFVNREGRLAIPCVWNDVFNFNNHRYYKTSVYDNPQDEDDRPWTSVRKGNLVGMIDTTGRVRVPVRFGFANRAQIVFRQTEKGELAPARDAKTGQWGLINRKGEWKVKPIYKNEEDVEL